MSISQPSDPSDTRTMRVGETRCMPSLHSNLELIRILTDRLERISADSVWAHRASGVRGALLRTLEQLQNGEMPDPQSMRLVISSAIYILSHAAKRK